MADNPVVLLGFARDGSGLSVVGLYETPDLVREAIMGFNSHLSAANCYYSIVTPELNSYTRLRQYPDPASLSAISDSE